MMDTTGCGTAIITPFRADGSIDEAALRALVNWQIDSGINFLVACGSTGEAATLDEEEWLHGGAHGGRGGGGPRAGVGRLHPQLHPHAAAPAPACSGRYAAWTPYFQPIPTTTSPPRRGSSSTFWRSQKRLTRCR